ncbi:MAG: type pilus assembly PilZ [Bryobacterales bacterium]|nr:type pilus assembly PilZ [Bryobacterales bacterium]
MEHRKTDRFPIETGVRYKLMEAARVAQTGQGRTVNISSCGILFSTESYLPLGQRAELSVDWPAQLNEHCGLKLVAIGKIVRSSGDTAVIRIEKYDFRTRAAAPFAASARSVN